MSFVAKRRKTESPPERQPHPPLDICAEQKPEEVLDLLFQGTSLATVLCHIIAEYLCHGVVAIRSFFPREKHDSGCTTSFVVSSTGSVSLVVDRREIEQYNAEGTRLFCQSGALAVGLRNSCFGPGPFVALGMVNDQLQLGSNSINGCRTHIWRDDGIIGLEAA